MPYPLLWVTWLARNTTPEAGTHLMPPAPQFGSMPRVLLKLTSFESTRALLPLPPPQLMPSQPLLSATLFRMIELFEIAIPAPVFTLTSLSRITQPVAPFG